MCSVFVMLFDKNVSRYLIESLTQNASALLPDGLDGDLVFTIHFLARYSSH